MEWSFGLDFGVEWSRILSFCHFSRTGFYDRPTDSDEVEWDMILEGTSRLKLRQSQTIFYDLPKMSAFIQQLWV